MRSKSPTRYGSVPTMRCWSSSATITGDDVLPTSTDMNLYGGIYREAELILTEKTAVSPLYLGSDGILVHQNSVGDERVEAEAEIHLVTGGENSCVLTLDITAPDGSRVFSKRQKTRIDGKPVTIPFSVDAPQLWSPANPALYRVSVSIGDATVTDSVAVRTGFRSIVASPGRAALRSTAAASRYTA